VAELVRAECGREPSPGGKRDDEWRVYSDGLELHVFCPECAEREFGEEGDLSGGG
jgi:hypothetical protein